MAWKRKNHGTTESQNCRCWKGSLGMIWSSLVLKQVPSCRSLRKASRWVLNISREGDSTVSLGSLCQSSAPSKFFFLFVWKSYLPVCACCPLLCLWAQLRRAWPHPLDFLCILLSLFEYLLTLFQNKSLIKMSHYSAAQRLLTILFFSFFFSEKSCVFPDIWGFFYHLQRWSIFHVVFLTRLEENVQKIQSIFFSFDLENN